MEFYYIVGIVILVIIIVLLAIGIYRSCFKNETSDQKQDTIHYTRGLVNLGNTCYMNSALQCMFSSIELNEHLLVEKEKEDNKFGKINENYTNLLIEQQLSNKIPINPKEFKNALEEVIPEFKGSAQNDSVKVISHLLELINEELNEVKVKPYQILKEKQGDETDDQASDRYWKYLESRNKSIIIDLFYGQYKSTICCTNCHESTVTFEPFSNILLPIPKHVSINVCIIFLEKKIIKKELIISEGLLLADLLDMLRDDLNSSKFKISIIKDGSLIEVNEFEKITNNQTDSYIFFNELTPFENDILIYAKENQNNHQICLVDPCPRLLKFEKNNINSLNIQVNNFIDELKKKYKENKFEIYLEGKEKDFNEKLKTNSLGLIEIDSESKFLEKGGKIMIKINTNSVSINNNKKSKIINDKLNISDCFKYLQCKEILENWYCYKCKQFRNVTKKLDLFRLPKLLIIYFKRFSSDPGLNNSISPVKIETDIDFPVDELDLTNFIDKSHEAQSKYELYAVSRHFGNIQSGHYTAVGKRENEWFEFNDSHVSKIDKSNINSRYAYLLFYRRK